MAGEPGHRCKRGERCVTDYQDRISGPFLDRIDIRIDVPAVSATDIIAPPTAESSSIIAARVLKARQIQSQRYENSLIGQKTNATASAAIIEQVAKPDQSGSNLLLEAATTMKLSARAYHRILKVARTIADLDEKEQVSRIHIAEAIAYRTSSKRLANAA